MNLYLAIALFITAVGYSAAGLGGGTGYLAVLTFWSHDLNVIRPLAWGFNILVAGPGFINFYRAGHFSLPFALPIVLGGTIGGAIGDRLPINGRFFTIALAVTLTLVAFKMFFGAGPDRPAPVERHLPWMVRFLIGLLTGVLAGLLGSGGGVVLGPAILLLGLAGIKRSAATTTLFVVLSSSGALGTHILSGGHVNLLHMAIYGSLCLVGGYFGSLYGARKASPRALEIGFGVLVLIAGLRLVWQMFFDLYPQ